VSLSRRRLLASVAALSAGCGAPGQAAPPEVRLVGPDPGRGHRLLGAGLEGRRIRDEIPVDVLVVGTGVAGAAAAWWLARAGVRDVHVVELEDAVGGTARGGTLPRSAYPMGAHYLPAPRRDDRRLHAMLRDLGLALGRDRRGEVDWAPGAICAAPIERHHLDGRWFEGLYPLHGQTGDEEAQWRAWIAHLRELDGRVGRDGRRLFALPVQHSSTELRDLDRISMASYLDRLGLSSWRLRWLVDYACRDDYGARLDQTSAFAALHHFLARGLEDEQDRFLLTFADGNAPLVAGMLELADLGDRLHLGAAARRVDADTGRVLVHAFADDVGLAFEARVVLWAAPRFVLSHVLAGGPVVPRLEQTAWLVANVELGDAPGGLGAPLSWDNVPVARTEGPVERWPSDLGYVVATHGEARTGAIAPGTVITHYEPLPADAISTTAQRRAWLAGAGVEELVERVMGSLSRLHPAIRSSVRRLDLHRWGHAMVLPRPGLLFGPELAAARAPVGRVLPCAADVTGLPLFEEAFHAGVAAAEAALTRLGRPRTE
jgi:glycine/D-amino acid oxidase-like deaminating enzyme